jgi:hypothetical protein
MTGLHPTRTYFKTFFAGKIFVLGKNNRPRKKFLLAGKFLGLAEKKGPRKNFGA